MLKCAETSYIICDVRCKEMILCSVLSAENLFQKMQNSANLVVLLSLKQHPTLRSYYKKTLS